MPEQESLDKEGSAQRRRHSRRTFIRTGLAVGGGLVASAYVKPFLQSIGVPRAFAQATPVQSTPPPCTDCKDILELEYDGGVPVTVKARDKGGTPLGTFSLEPGDNFTIKGFKEKKKELKLWGSPGLELLAELIRGADCYSLTCNDLRTLTMQIEDLTRK